MHIWVLVRKSLPAAQVYSSSYVDPCKIISSFKKYDDANRYVGELIDKGGKLHNEMFYYELVETELHG